MNVKNFEPAPPGNRPSALTTKLYVVIKLLRKFLYVCYNFFMLLVNLQEDFHKFLKNNYLATKNNYLELSFDKRVCYILNTNKGF